MKPQYEGAAIHEFKLDGGFSVLSLVGAMIANCFAAFKAAESHKIMDKEHGDKGLQERLGGPTNQFAVMTIISFFVSVPLIPLHPYVNGKDPMVNMQEFYNVATTNKASMTAIVASGFAFYLYNEFATLSLKKLSPVTSSVANTFKRVFVIIAGILMYEDERKKATAYTAIGCAICMFGVGLYSCIDEILKPKAKKE